MGQEFLGFGIAGDLFFFGVPFQGAAKGVGDIAEMTGGN